MTALSVAALYSGLLILVGVALQVRVVQIRRAKRIGIGTGNDRELEKAVRVHGNFVENAVFAIAGMILLALTSAPVGIIHAVGLLMLAGRLIHAFGLTQTAGSSVARVGGMVASFSSQLIAAVTLIVRAFL